MTKPDPLNVPAWLDPYAITFDSRDGAWTHEIRFVLTPAGLKAWSLTTTPSGRSIQALGVSPDIIVSQPRARPETLADPVHGGLGS